jgi:hypothetical protein
MSHLEQIYFVQLELSARADGERGRTATTSTQLRTRAVEEQMPFGSFARCLVFIIISRSLSLMYSDSDQRSQDRPDEEDIERDERDNQNGRELQCVVAEDGDVGVGVGLRLAPT